MANPSFGRRLTPLAGPIGGRRARLGAVRPQAAEERPPVPQEQDRRADVDDGVEAGDRRRRRGDQAGGRRRADPVAERDQHALQRIVVRHARDDHQERDQQRGHRHDEDQQVADDRLDRGQGVHAQSPRAAGGAPCSPEPLRRVEGSGQAAANREAEMGGVIERWHEVGAGPRPGGARRAPRGRRGLPLAGRPHAAARQGDHGEIPRRGDRDARQLQTSAMSSSGSAPARRCWSSRP